MNTDNATAKETVKDRSAEEFKVGVIGLGYVGLPLALLLKKNEYDVLGIEIDEEKLRSLAQGLVPFKDGRLTQEINAYKIDLSSDYRQLSDRSTIVVCVPTPVNHDYSPDFGPLKVACEDLAPHLKKGQLVIIESTINPGTCEEIVVPILENGSGLKAGTDFELSHCPERINPGDDNWDVENIPRVIGSLSDKGLERTHRFYKSILKNPIKLMASIKEAEAVKIVENSFRDINIAFVNELAMSFDRLGIDLVSVIEGASTKPFAFMPHFPGCGVGGHCIPVDPYYLISYAEKNGFHHNFLSMARQINNGMTGYTVRLLKNALGESMPNVSANGNGAKQKTKVAILGIAYKPEISDYRESPSLKIIEELNAGGYEVATFDPYVPDQSTSKSIWEAVDKAQAVIVATAHGVFKDLSPEYFIDRGVKVIIDGRNCLAKESFINSGIIYKGIGR